MVPGFMIKIFDKEKWDACKVVAVEVTENNRIQSLRIDSGSLHRQQCRRSTVQKNQAIACLNEIAALMTTAAAEGVTTSQNMKFHWRPLACHSTQLFP